MIISPQMQNFVLSSVPDTEEILYWVGWAHSKKWVEWQRGGVVVFTYWGGETCPSAQSRERRSLWGVGLQTKETHTRWHRSTRAKEWGAQLHNFLQDVPFTFLGGLKGMCVLSLWAVPVLLMEPYVACMS